MKLIYMVLIADALVLTGAWLGFKILYYRYEKQINRLFAIANSAGVDAEKVKEQIYIRFNKTVKELTKQEYDIACEGYQKMVK